MFRFHRFRVFILPFSKLAGKNVPFSREWVAYPPRFHRFQNVLALCERSIKNVFNQSLISEVILNEAEVNVKLRFVGIAEVLQMQLTPWLVIMLLKRWGFN